jgi:hypothetical protein
MRFRESCSLFLPLIASVAAAAAQTRQMPGQRLFAARLESTYVVPSSKSRGSGTGVFILSADSGRPVMLRYRLTYALLSSPEVRSITLRNFGAGKEGEVVHALCGLTAERCASGTDGTVQGQWSSADSQAPLNPQMLTELANRRIYVEVETALGKEIRSQLATSPFMIRAEEAQVSLQGSATTQKVNGTAAIRWVRFPNRAEVSLLLTIAGSAQDATGATVVDSKRRFAPLRFKPSGGRKAGRTLWVIAQTPEYKTLANPAFFDAFTRDDLRLVVDLGTKGAVLQGTIESLR